MAVQQLEGFLRVGAWAEHQPVHLAADGSAHRFQLALGILIGIEDDDLIALFAQNVLQRFDLCRKQWVGNIAHYHSDGICPPGAQGTGNGVLHIAHFLCGFLNARLGILRHQRGVPQGQRDGVCRHADPLRNAFERWRVAHC